MENVEIRKGKKSDLPEVLSLIKELAAYEKAPNEVTNTLEDLENDGFGVKPVFGLLVACVDTMVVGMAIYFVKYSTWKGKGIYLEDIVIKESFRNKGIGKMLFKEVIKLALDAGAKQLHWQVLDWNEPAIQFYKKYNTYFDDEWVNCKMDEQQLRKFSDDGF